MTAATMMSSSMPPLGRAPGHGHTGPPLAVTMGHDDEARGALGSREKLTFKAKLHGMIAQAEAAELAALQAQQLQDKKSLCIAMLVEGRPHAFVDFFYLTHATNNNTGAGTGGGAAGGASGAAAGGTGAAGGGDEIPQSSLAHLREQLTRAEVASKAGDPEQVYGAYRELAKYFAAMGLLRKADFFFRRCLAIARDAGWLAGELEASLALGVVAEELGDMAQAVACHERRLELASDNLMQPDMDAAYRSLAAVYMRQAEALEASHDEAGAAESYGRCLTAAGKAQDAPAAARATLRLGLLHHRGSRWVESMHYLQRFIEAAAALGDASASDVDAVAVAADEGLAHTTHAECLQQLGDSELAVASLEQYLLLARGRDPKGSAVACCSLGILHYRSGDYDGAVTYFEKFFEAARALPVADRRMLDAARINLGVARGAARMPQYLKLVATDLPRLIEWKAARVPFGDTAPSATPRTQLYQQKVQGPSTATSSHKARG